MTQSFWVSIFQSSFLLVYACLGLILAKHDKALFLYFVGFLWKNLKFRVYVKWYCSKPCWVFCRLFCMVFMCSGIALFWWRNPLDFLFEGLFVLDLVFMVGGILWCCVLAGAWWFGCVLILLLVSLLCCLLSVPVCWCFLRFSFRSVWGPAFFVACGPCLVVLLPLWVL